MVERSEDWGSILAAAPQGDLSGAPQPCHPTCSRSGGAQGGGAPSWAPEGGRTTGASWGSTQAPGMWQALKADLSRFRGLRGLGRQLGNGHEALERLGVLGWMCHWCLPRGVGVSLRARWGSCSPLQSCRDLRWNWCSLEMTAGDRLGDGERAQGVKEEGTEPGIHSKLVMSWTEPGGAGDGEQYQVVRPGLDVLSCSSGCKKFQVSPRGMARRGRARGSGNEDCASWTAHSPANQSLPPRWCSCCVHAGQAGHMGLCWILVIPTPNPPPETNENACVAAPDRE